MGTGTIKDAGGLPWGAVLTPFSPLSAPPALHVRGSDVARCSSCFAYISKLMYVTRNRWKCPLCNEWSLLEGDRYKTEEKRKYDVPFPLVPPL